MRLILSSILILQFFATRAQQPGQVKVTSYYDQQKTAIKEIYYLQDSSSGILEGPYNQYYQSGKLAASLTYKQGEANGPAIYFYENGNPKMRGELEQGQNTGYWVYYYENGNVRQEGALTEGKKTGPWIFYFENGREKRKGGFQKDKKNGIWNYFFEDGTLKAQAIYDNDAGTYKEFYTSGKLKIQGENVNGKSEGLWIFYYEDGTVEAEGNYTNGLKTDNWNYYHENGNLAATGPYENGVKQGAWKYYYSDGTVSSEGIENNGTKDGYWKFYYESGETKGEIAYDTGTGAYQEFYPNGKMKIEGNITSEKREGEWVFYTEEGKLEGRAIYKNDTALYEGYYPDGSLKMQGEMAGSRKIKEWSLFNPDGSLAGKYKPIYEDEDPVYITSETIKASSGISYKKPAYRFKNRRWRYFDSRINEYRAYIVSVDPSLLLGGRLTASLEYYFQERMGYEIHGIFHRNPFFSNKSKIAQNEIFKSGLGFKVRQRFYSRDGDFGMFYFGHELGFAQLEYESLATDSLLVRSSNPLKIDESRFQYGLFIGNRWMQNAGEAGITVDLYVGIGIGWRNQNSNFSNEPIAQSIFTEVSEQKNFFPFLFGLQIGFAGPRRKNASF